MVLPEARYPRSERRARAPERVLDALLAQHCVQSGIRGGATHLEGDGIGLAWRDGEPLVEVKRSAGPQLQEAVVRFALEAEGRRCGLRMLDEQRLRERSE